MSVCERRDSYFGAHEEAKLSWQSCPWRAKAHSVAAAGVRNYMGRGQGKKKNPWGLENVCVVTTKSFFLYYYLVIPYKV